MGVVIEFENVSKSFSLYHHMTGGIKNFLFNLKKNLSDIGRTRFESLHGISFSVQAGETFGIIGVNGAGKSTTLGLIAGVLKPSSGAVRVKGRVSSLLELGAGFHPELTGRENILLNGILIGLNRRQVLGKMDEIIEFSGLGDFISQPIRVYSSGMLSRLGFSVVAHLEPEILLIDEILAVGDDEFRKKCAFKMAEFKEKGVTMVLVSHAVDDVLSICDRVMWIENHRVKMIGEPAPVLSGYLGKPVQAAAGI
jgi:lipopolysaccharide transport system ATP-binding protein